MKKIISLILALALTVGCVLALASCGEEINAKVGIQSGTTSEAYAKVLKGVEVVSFDSFALAATGMKNGNVDYVFVDKTTANELCKEISGLKIIDIALSSENYGIGIDPAQKDLKTKIDAILADKADEIDAIKEKYMNGDEDAYVGVESATKDVNKAASQLVVATNAEFAPWEYKEGNLYYGIDMEIAMSGITITTERLEKINFSTPYYVESIVVVCKADDNTFAKAGTVVDILNSICYPAE